MTYCCPTAFRMNAVAEAATEDQLQHRLSELESCAEWQSYSTLHSWFEKKILWAGKLSRYLTSQPGQLSLTIPLWVGSMSTS